ncbi:putative ATP-NAD-dependent kinase [Babesia divergens]|uniref:ATP-NAD-dependent kinase n=1 Tax=Babesia divergens TaxID=32595 RepID=A0AAD9G9M3_BABDI|nr:putative ATP-NAD-dependent kinase [Babesia divergens]
MDGRSIGAGFKAKRECLADPANVAKLLSSTNTEELPPIEQDVVVVYQRKPKKILICSSKTEDAVINARQEVLKHVMEVLDCVVVVHDCFLPVVEAETHRLWGVVYNPGTNIPSEPEKEEKELCELQTDDVELIIAIGGDGTILKVIKMFPHVIPPVIGLSMGSMGYLAKFNMDQVKETLSGITEHGLTVSRRRLLHVEIYDQDDQLIARRNALNECVVDRGISPYIATLDVYYQGSYFTTVTGDGLLISTPSGSTAYSMAAGGPIVHPVVSSMLFTVICPHSISFRPVVLPSDSVLDIIIPADNRAPVRVCVDGNYDCELQQGCHLKITTSSIAFPLVLPNNTRTGEEWNRALKNHLHWNHRVRQQPMQTPAEVPSMHPGIKQKEHDSQ